MLITSHCRYGGPGSQQVTHRFRLGWDAYLSSTENIIIVQVDGRGSGARGQTYLHSIYKKLGTLEVQDQITAVRYSRCSSSRIFDVRLYYRCIHLFTIYKDVMQVEIILTVIM